MKTKPNAAEITLHRWFIGDDKRCWYVVTWENSNDYEDSDTAGEEQERKFRSMDAAFRFSKRLWESSGD